MSNDHEMKPIDAQSSSGETDRSLHRRSADGPGLEPEFAPRSNKASWKDDLRYGNAPNGKAEIDPDIGQGSFPH